MPRMVLAAATSALLLAGCASDYDYNSYPDGQEPWRMTQTGHETDYEVLGDVLFRNDSADLSDNAQRVIGLLAREARNKPGATIVVDGFTDTLGTPDHNLDLSHASRSGGR